MMISRKLNRIVLVAALASLIHPRDRVMNLTTIELQTDTTVQQEESKSEGPTFGGSTVDSNPVWSRSWPSYRPTTTSRSVYASYTHELEDKFRRLLFGKVRRDGWRVDRWPCPAVGLSVHCVKPRLRLWTNIYQNARLVVGATLCYEAYSSG